MMNTRETCMIDPTLLSFVYIPLPYSTTTLVGNDLLPPSLAVGLLDLFVPKQRPTPKGFEEFTFNTGNCCFGTPLELFAQVIPIKRMFSECSEPLFAVCSSKPLRATRTIKP